MLILKKWYPDLTLNEIRFVPAPFWIQICWYSFWYGRNSFLLLGQSRRLGIQYLQDEEGTPGVGRSSSL